MLIILWVEVLDIISDRNSNIYAKWDVFDKSQLCPWFSNFFPFQIFYNWSFNIVYYVKNWYSLMHFTKDVVSYFFSSLGTNAALFFFTLNFSVVKKGVYNTLYSRYGSINYLCLESMVVRINTICSTLSCPFIWKGCWAE